MIADLPLFASLSPEAPRAAAGPVTPPLPLAADTGPATVTLRGLVFHQDTRRDILVSRSGDPEAAVWLRKPLIDFELIPGGLVDVICPAALAAERSLT